MKDKIIIDSDISRRYKDENGYLHIKDNPIAKCGVFPYLKREVREYDSKDPEGDEVVQVYRSFKDLEKNKDLFKNKPIILDHTWVGKEGDKNEVSGVIIGDIRAIEPYLRADLIIYDDKLINDIENGNIVELSPGYECDIIEVDDSYEDQPYQYEQLLKNVNHLAVVERGRSGRDLKILDSNSNLTKGEKLMRILDFLFSKKTSDSDLDFRNDKSLIKIEDSETLSDPKMEKFYSQDKKCIIKVTDNKVEVVNEDEEKVEIEDEDEVVEVKDEEKVEIEDEDEVVIEDEDEDEDDNKSKKTSDSAKLKALVKKEISKIEDKYTLINKAYNDVKRVIDSDFDCSGLSVNQIYAYGYQTLTGKELKSGHDAKTAFDMASENMTSKRSVFAQDSFKKLEDKEIDAKFSILR